MSLFTRREFIKSLLTLAGAAGLPGIKIQELEQELVPPADTSAIEPTSPRGEIAPAGYLQIDGIKYQVLAMAVTQRIDMDTVPEWGDEIMTYSAGVPYWGIEATISGDPPLSLVGKLVEFELIPTNGIRYLDGLIGKSYITGCTTEFSEGYGGITTLSLESSNEPLFVRMPNGEIVKIERPRPPEPEPSPEIDDDENAEDYWGGYDVFDIDDWGDE